MRNEQAQKVLQNQRPMRHAEYASKESLGGGASSERVEVEPPNSAKIFVGGLTQDTNERKDML